MRNYHQDSLLFAVQLQQQLADVAGDVAVEVAGRLIGQQQHRSVDEPRATATRWRSPPDSSAGRCSSRLDSPTRSSKVAPTAQHRSGRRATRWREDVLKDGTLRQQVMVLEDETDVTVAEVGQIAFGQGKGVVALQADTAGGGRFEGAEEVEQGALAGTGRPHDGDGRPALDLEADVTEDRQRAAASGVVLAQVFDLQRHQRLRIALGVPGHRGQEERAPRLTFRGLR